MTGILNGNSKDEPLHYGEIFTLWSASTMAKGTVSCYRAYLNHAGDKDLKKVLGALIDQAELEISECDAILADNGLGTAPSLPDRPQVNLEDIPVGARFSDPEIAAKIGAENAAGLVACSQAMGQSIREDVGGLFAKYHLTKAGLGMRILKMNKEKGWIIPPPLQVKRPEAVKV